MSSDEDTFINLSCTDSDVENSDNDSNESNDDNTNNEGCIIPYNFEPYLSDSDNNCDNDDLDMNDSASNNEIPMDIQRLQNTEW